MLKARVIPCLDVDGGRVVKGVKFLLLNDDELTSILPDGVEVAAYLG